MSEGTPSRFNEEEETHRESNWKSIERTAGSWPGGPDLDWRPDTYWPEGQEEPPVLITDDDELADEYGEAPGFYAGSHIPDLDSGEVEIACVLMNSVLGDAVSVRARPLTDGGIGYRIVDEHEEPYDCVPSRSDRPLSLREVGELLDRSEAAGGTAWGPGIPWTPLRCTFEFAGSTDGLFEFLDVYSEVYPDLGDWYSIRISGWLDQLGADDDEEEFEEDEDDDAWSEEE